jgi:hypothetical protein
MVTLFCFREEETAARSGKFDRTASSQIVRPARKPPAERRPGRRDPNRKPRRRLTRR